MRQTLSGCRCSSTDWLRMERRIEPEPALGGKVARSSDVGDQEAVVEHAAVHLEAEQLAHADCARRRRRHASRASAR